MDTAPQVFATEWSKLGGPQARAGIRQGVYAADGVIIPFGVPGQLRPATYRDEWLLRDWAKQLFIEAGTTLLDNDQIGPRIDAGLMFVWEVDGAAVSMAAVTVAQGGVSRVQLVYTPPEKRRRDFASACVASLTERELATRGRTCMLYTDLDNPTSNAIYQAVGYRLVAEAVELRFGAPSRGRG